MPLWSIITHRRNAEQSPVEHCLHSVKNVVLQMMDLYYLHVVYGNTSSMVSNTITLVPVSASRVLAKCLRNSVILEGFNCGSYIGVFPEDEGVGYFANIGPNSPQAVRQN